jgi:hypothetical protein
MLLHYLQQVEREEKTLKTENTADPVVGDAKKENMSRKQ